MKNISTVLVIVISLFFIQNKAGAQTTDTSSYRYKLAKTWYFNYDESFGIQSKPDSTEKHDMIVFKPDLSYQMTMNGASSTGTWSVSEASHFLTFTDGKTKQVRNIKITGLIKDQLALKWQAPDLTAIIKYYYTK